MREIDNIDIYVRAVTSTANQSQYYTLFLGCLFGEDAQEIIDLTHAKDPDLVVRVHNGVLRRKGPQLLAELGEVQLASDLWVNKIRILRHSARMAQKGFNDGGIASPPLPDFESMTHDEASEAFLDWMTGVLGADAMAQVAKQRELDDGVGKADDRGLKIMAGTISEKSKRRFSSSLRDCGHMAVFASFADDIDFLQIDGPKLNEIQAQSGHYLRKMDLANRCFAARTLAEVTDAVQDMVNSAQGWA